MLVQPALTTHLLCRPVSIADSTGPRRELQVLCEKGALCYVLVPAFGTARPNWRAPLPLIRGFGSLVRNRLRLAIVHLDSPRNQLLQLALDIRIAHVLILQHAVGVDGKCGRNRSHTELRRDLAREASVAILQPRHSVLLDEFLPLGFVVVQADAEHHQRLSLESLCNLPNMRQSLAA